jgi:hypothetical protein
VIQIPSRAALLVFLLTGSVPAQTPEATESAADEKDVVRGSDDVERQRKLKTEKESDADAEDTDDRGPASPAAAGEADAPDTGHQMQFGLRAGIVFGYRMFFRYDESPFCTEPFTDEQDPQKQQSICGFGAPPATELALSFAPFDSIEPYIFARLGFSGEAQTNTDPLRMMGIGARIYTMSDEAFKLFVEPALAYQFEQGAGDPSYCSGESRDVRCGDVRTDYKRDLVFHLGIGPQYDFARYVGIYLNAGIDVGILRAIHATLLANVGLQARFP